MLKFKIVLIKSLALFIWWLDKRLVTPNVEEKSIEILLINWFWSDFDLVKPFDLTGKDK